MLPRSLRLSRKGFETARDLSRATSQHFSVSYKTGVEDGGSAVIVPKKVIKGAVARHLLKRRVRAILRPWSAKDRILIVSARSGSEGLSYEDTEGELSSLFGPIINR